MAEEWEGCRFVLSCCRHNWRYMRLWTSLEGAMLQVQDQEPEQEQVYCALDPTPFKP